LTIFSTPAGSSSPCVSFLRFSSKARSKLWRVCSSEFLMLSSWLAIVVVRRADVEPVVLLDAGQVGLVDRRALGDLLRAAVGDLADQQLLDPVERVGLDDAQLVVQVEADSASARRR
jgi:hypothetical protein